MGVLKEKVGGIWTPVGLDGFASMARGVIGYSARTSNQTGISTETDILDCAVTVTLPAGRRIRISGQLPIQMDATAGAPYIQIKEGTTGLGRVVYEEQWPANKIGEVAGSVILTPTGGSHTYKLTGMKFVGAGSFNITASAANPAFIVVEDLGPVFPSTWNDSYSAIPNVAGYAQVTANQTGITTETDLTGLSVTIAAAANHRYRITGFVRALSTVAGDGLDLGIFEGATRLVSAPVRISVASGLETWMASTVITPAAGAHTYKLRLARFAGTGTASTDASATAPLYILVEDLGDIYGSFGSDNESYPRGVLGYAQVTADQTGIGTTVTDLTGLSVAVTVGTGRRIKVSGHGIVVQIGSAATPIVYLREGTTQLGRIEQATLNAGIGTTFDGAIILTPTAGSHTYKLSLNTSGGTTDIQAGSIYPAYILVEDIGKA